DLRSDVSETADLAATLREFIDRVRSRSGLDITLTVDQGRRLPLVYERELWNIVREAVINVERHAQATRAWVGWCSTDSTASLSVRDNGVGILFGADRVDAYGLVGMRERAAAIGASLSTESTPDGTVISVDLRIPPGAKTWD
ncbi:MAG TPA: hypothetical protein PLV68_18085, partial [Ilumatobacteraceae bacterium]|nr:hypothetical protein [Ilumatobacteraceae bacterium]